jgi:aspartate kinase
MTTKKIIVQKYGGTSVKNAERIKAVASRIKGYVDKDYSVVVVVSAMGKATDELIDLANQISAVPNRREMDMLLSTGEQVSIALLSMALNEINIRAISHTGSQVKVITDGNFMNARIESISKEKLQKSLEKHQVVIVAGFQGIDRDENITTLGRGGSDTSAVALAAVLGCRDCEIYTDVDGVYTADPRVVENPIKLKEISYEGMLELARLGAGVLHSRSVEFAKKYNVRLHVRSSYSMEEGTIVMPQEEMVEKYLISGVTAKKDEAKINIRDIEDKPGIAAGLFELLAAEKIYINMIVQSTGLKDRASISFTVLKQDLDRAMAIAEKFARSFGSAIVDCKKDISIVSAVGVGMLSSYGVAARMFRVLADEDINIEMISTSEIGISCVVDTKYSELAQKIIHGIFLEEEK